MNVYNSNDNIDKGAIKREARRRKRARKAEKNRTEREQRELENRKEFLRQREELDTTNYKAESSDKVASNAIYKKYGEEEHTRETLGTAWEIKPSKK